MNMDHGNQDTVDSKKERRKSRKSRLWPSAPRKKRTYFIGEWKMKNQTVDPAELTTSDLNDEGYELFGNAVKNEEESVDNVPKDEEVELFVNVAKKEKVDIEIVVKNEEEELNLVSKNEEELLDQVTKKEEELLDHVSKMKEFSADMNSFDTEADDDPLLQAIGAEHSHCLTNPVNNALRKRLRSDRTLSARGGTASGTRKKQAKRSQMGREATLKSSKNSFDDVSDPTFIASPENCAPKRECDGCHRVMALNSLAEAWRAERYTYAAMLRDCLGVELIPLDGALNVVLCDTCAVRLRNAIRFRRDVLKARERFRDDVCKRDNDTVAAVQELPEEDDIADNVKKELIRETKTNCFSPNGAKKSNNGFSRQGRDYRCSRCTVTFRRLRDIKEHVEEHWDKFHCPDCPKTFKYKKLLAAHGRAEHPAKRCRRHECPLCHQIFTVKEKLLKHKHEEHGLDDELACKACDRHFSTARLLEIHMLSYHMLGEKIQCSLCDYVCYHQRLLTRHMRKHGTKKYHCKYCTKSFAKSSTLSSHVRIHTGDKRKACAECGQAFVQKASLNYHMAKHHPSVRF